MASMVVRTASLIGTTSRLRRDTPIQKPSDLGSNSQETSRVATKTFSELPQQERRVSPQGGGGGPGQGLQYYKQQDKTNRELREISGAFRARL